MTLTLKPAPEPGQYEKGEDLDPETGLFLKGKKGGPGRPKGSKNKLGEQLLLELQQDFEKHGKSAIVEMRTEKPAEYVKALISLLPKDVNLNVNKYEDLDDTQLLTRLRQLDAAIYAMLPGVDSSAAGTGGNGRRAEGQTEH